MHYAILPTFYYLYKNFIQLLIYIIYLNICCSKSILKHPVYDSYNSLLTKLADVLIIF